MCDNEFNELDEDFNDLVRGVVCSRGANRGGRRGRGACANIGNRNLLSREAVNNIHCNSSNPGPPVRDSPSSGSAQCSN